MKYNINATIIVHASASGIVSQIPVTPNILGKISMNKITKIKDLKDEITADIKPFPNAVK